MKWLDAEVKRFPLPGVANEWRLSGDYPDFLRSYNKGNEIPGEQGFIPDPG